MKFRSRVDLRSTNDAPAGWGTVAEAMLTACSASERRALCVTGSGRSGRLFVESQHVVHAEYGDEVGLAALVEMLRAGRVRISVWKGAWPWRRTLRLGPVALLARSAVPGAPPPLPAETQSSVAAEAGPASAAAPAALEHDERTRLWSRSGTAQTHSEGEAFRAANDFRSSGVFCRSATAQNSEAASAPGSPNDAVPAAEAKHPARSPAALFTGALTELGLADLLQIFQWLRRSAVIRITRDEFDSHIWCESGDIIDAESGPLRGEAAVYRTLGFEYGSVIAELRTAHRARTIFSPTHRLVLEAAWRKDVAAPLRRTLGDERQALRCAGKSAPAGLRPEELGLLRSFTTAQTASAALQASGLGDFETLKLLARWIQSGDLVPVSGSEHT
jgi:hypothetical protein